MNGNYSYDCVIVVIDGDEYSASGEIDYTINWGEPQTRHCPGESPHVEDVSIVTIDEVYKEDDEIKLPGNAPLETQLAEAICEHFMCAETGGGHDEIVEHAKKCAEEDAAEAAIENMRQREEDY